MKRGLSARLFAVTFVFAGTLHFVRPKMYEAIMPPYIPAHPQMVAVSGAAEIVGGLAALFPKLDRFTRLWMIALLIAVFPANVYMALNPEDIKGLDVPRGLLWARLPVQALFIAWAIRVTRED